MESDVKGAYLAWLAAAGAADQQWYLDNLSDSFVYIGLGGGGMSREELASGTAATGGGDYRLLSFQCREFGGLWQAWGTYSARCDMPADFPVPDSMRQAYARGCELAFLNLWQLQGDELRCVSHATVILDS